MNKRHFCFLLLAGLACVFLATSVAVASEIPLREAAVGHLTINRLPNLGGGVTAFVSIDGVSAGRMRFGQSYHGLLVPGDHFISIMVYPNHMILSPAEKRFSVQGGQSYMFTLKWNGDRLVLM